MNKIIFNWSQVIAIEETDYLKDGYVYVSTYVGRWENGDDDEVLRQGTDTSAFLASSIEVVGEGSMRVNQWLHGVAKKASKENE